MYRRFKELLSDQRWNYCAQYDNCYEYGILIKIDIYFYFNRLKSSRYNKTVGLVLIGRSINAKFLLIIIYINY